MNMKKKFVCLVLSAVAVSSLSMPIFASEVNTVAPISFNKSMQTIELIEDNGQPYEEININCSGHKLLRSSGSYNSTYDITGGVYTRTSWTCDEVPTYTVLIDPSSYDGADDTTKLAVHLERKTTWGWSRVDDATVNATYGGEVTLTGDTPGTYRIYLRNNTGVRAQGNIYISYTCE